MNKIITLSFIALILSFISTSQLNAQCSNTGVVPTIIYQEVNKCDGQIVIEFPVHYGGIACGRRFLTNLSFELKLDNFEYLFFEFDEYAGTATTNPVTQNGIHWQYDFPYATGPANEFEWFVSGGIWWARITYNIPAAFFGLDGWELKSYRKHFVECGGRPECDDINPIGSFAKINVPTISTASVDQHCSHVALEINFPTPFSFSCNSNWSVQLFRDNVPLPNNGNSLTYNDFDATPGVDHEYQVRALWSPNGVGTYASPLSAKKIGRKKGANSPPTNFTASTNSCDEEVILSWQTLSPATAYYIFRNNIAIDTITDGSTNYTDEDPPLSQDINYHVRSNNDCNLVSQPSVTRVGRADGPPPEPGNVAAITQSNGIRINWTSAGSGITGYVIERTFPGSGSAFVINNISPDSTSYFDDEVVQCVTYTYTIKSKSRCYPNGYGQARTSALISPDLTMALPPNSFDASKGYYADKIELTWTNNQPAQTNLIKIYRRILDSGNAFALLTTLNSTSGIYNDPSATAGELYEYEIVAEGPCEGSTIESNRLRTIGYRRRTGIVTGRVGYADGTAVKDVRISANDPEITVLPSLLFSGSDSATVFNSASLQMNNALILESWIKPVSTTYSNNFSILNKKGSYSLDFDSVLDQYVFSIQTDNGSMSISLPQDSLPVGYWNSIAGMFYQDSLKIFLSGKLISKIPVTANSNIVDNNNNVIIGKGLSGYLKDVRIWNQGKTNLKIQQNHARFLAGNEAGLVMYLYMGEGKGNFAYDLARLNTNYRKNHGSLSPGIIWDNTENPSLDGRRLVDLISVATFTDALGNYNLVVPYGGAGQNFVITPIFNIHKFLPPTTGVFLGDGSQVQNGVNFIDDSSFEMTGTVLFKDMTCGVKDVLINIDGVPAQNNMGVIFTDPDGKFSIRVPIGPHIITMSKNGHVFSVGRFPETGTFDFQAPVYNEVFIDSTLRTVVGRVVGGTREQAKPIGIGRSINNIGVANLTFDPTAACGWRHSATEIFPIRVDSTIMTNTMNGEYNIQLPPLNYNVINVGNDYVNFANQPLNLVNKQTVQHVADTTFVPGTNIVESIDSVSFNAKLEFIHRVTPDIDVTNAQGTGPIKSDEEYVFFHEVYGRDTIPLTPVNPFPFPVFTQNKNYSALISTFEEYVNHDGPAPVADRVPVLDGVILITNELAANPSTVINLNNAGGYDGDTLYTFKGGRPNLTSDGGLTSFTKEFRIDLSAGPNSASWSPIYKAYLVGTEDVAQADFAVNGPSLVSYILRDPPGSQSFAKRSLETSTTTESSFEWNAGGSGSSKFVIAAGPAFETGIGYVTETNVVSTINIGISSQISGGQGGSIIEKMVNTETWTTSADPLLAGPQSDLFIGTSDVFLFGVSTSLFFTPDSTCTNPTISCLTDIPLFPGDYRAATIKRMALAKSGIATDFVLPRWKIETDEIPDLIEQRNALLTNSADYTPHLPINHPCFGYNNDDERLGTSECPNTLMGTGDPERTTILDRIGPSYTFNTSDPTRIDSVRIWNQSIRLWKEALAFDEKQKFEAVQRGDPEIGNKVFAGASGTFERSISNGITAVNQQQFEFAFSENLSVILGVIIGGIGGTDEHNLSITQKRTSKEVQTVDSTHTTSFTLADNSEWDDFTVDIHEGGAMGSPIFNVLGGRTSCPHEGPFLSKYYQPGSVLSAGTIQLERPEILISPSVLFNVPQEEAGIFHMTLRNNNQVGESWEYATQINNTTNPNSLRVSIGTAPNLSTTWVLPPVGQPGGSFTRDFSANIGTSYDYDSIMVVMHSTCQYQAGQSVESDIVDTAYFSIHFIPGCTNIAMPLPGDQWVFNNSFNNVMRLRADDYNINYLNLDFIRLEYKPTSQPTWLSLETYYKDSTILETNPEAAIIPRNTAFTSYDWDMNIFGLPDGQYDLRAISDCQLATDESPVYRGYIDRINPHAFGTPSPGDGILDPNDDIFIKFNEVIDIGSVSPLNITVKGVVNGTTLSENASVSFDGVNDYGVIPEYQLQKRDFTLEFWLKRDRFGIEEAVLSQSNESSDQLYVGFNADNTIHFQLGDRVGNGQIPVTDNLWHHYAISYDRAQARVLISIDNAVPEVFITNFFTDYNTAGPIYVGKHLAGGFMPFQGKMRELRLWGISRTLSEIAPKSTRTLSGREAGLIGNWPMNEIYGTQAKDKVRSRHMALNGASWSVDPQSHSYMFDGISDSLRVVNAGQLSFTDEADLTFEVWIKTPGNGQKMSVLSNGASAAGQPYWELFINPAGNFVVSNNGNEVIAPLNITDDQWHHIAVVVERTRSVSLYHNGALVQTANASLFTSFGGPSLYLGVLGVQNNDLVDYSNFFVGKLDDVRIWNLARRPEQIVREFVNQLRGDELGLAAYYPFDVYSEGNNVYTTSLQDASNNSFDLSPSGIANSFSLITPLIKLPRRIESLAFDYSINGDEMIIVPDIAPNLIENVTLDITVAGVRDIAGNTMSSAETWIAYINKNQVFWETEYYNLQKNVDGSLSFTGTIKNTGGRQEQYTISNLPAWLSASSPTGLIEPNSDMDINFTILPGINIGEYEQDIYVSTESFGFNERLLLDLKVFEDPPTWVIDPNNFSFSMNITGQFRVNEVISSDEEDIVSVWVNNELRGRANVTFNQSSGKYLLFLTLYSNNSSPGIELLEFRAWDASRGNVLVGLEPSQLYFANNELLGSPSNPISIIATVLAERSYNLNSGWNWISFPLASTTLDDVNETLSDLSSVIGDQVKSSTQFDVYNGSIWDGNLERFNTDEAYKIKIANADNFSYSGSFQNPADEPISIEAGWNWVGVKSEFNVDISTVLNSLQDLQTGDVIKGQQSFAQYDSEFGWIGSLSFLQPQKGYMLYYNTNGILTYPGNGQSFREPEEKLIATKSAKERSYHKSSEFSYGNYSSTMSLIAEIEECLVIGPNGEFMDLSDWQLAAYAGTEMRGINEANWIPAFNKYIYYLSIEGDETTDITFKLIHSYSGEMIQLNQGLTYEVNQITGSIRAPFRFTCGNIVTCEDNVFLRTADIDPTQSNISKGAQFNFKTDAVLPSGISFRFSGGNELEFIGGFESALGAAIEAYIESCNN